ncbi:MBG domain-containing protein [Massilia sp. SYSU DXS3249]
MNNTYRLVWNATLSLWQAAPETAKGRGKNKSSRALRPFAGVAAFALASAAWSGQLPGGGTVVAGQATISQSGNVMTIDQSTAKAAIDWLSFSIGQGDTVVFRQPSASSVALNRVVGGTASFIEGALRANGQVFLLNPNGVLFAPTAQVNTGGLLASTLGMQTADFMNGRYQLEGANSSMVINQGLLQAANGGAVALVAAQIINTGTIEAPGGGVALGAGSKVLVDMGGPVKLQVQQGIVNALIDNGGAIRADGGTVLLTAAAASELAGSVINQSGTLRAQTLATGAKGEILLLADAGQGQLNVGGTLDASAPAGGDGGAVTTSAGRVATSAGLAVNAGAAQGSGGQWLLAPTDYTINAAAAQTISSALNTGTSVTVATRPGSTAAGADIAVTSAVAKSAGGDATLTLRAGRNVLVGADIGATNGKLGMVLSGGNGGGAYGGVRVGGNLNANGGDILVGGARGTANQGIGFAANLNASEAAVVVEQHKSILSNGGNITINGRSTVGSNNGSYGGVTGGVYIKSGAKILSGTGDLYVTGESSGGLKTFGIAFEAASGTNTVLGSATNGGNMLMNAVNSSAGTAAERDAGAMGMVNYGSVARLSFYGPSVASWLVFINGVPQLSGYTRTPQLNCVAGYLNCGYLVVPGSNNSYLYAGYESVSLATQAAYVIQSGAGTKVYDGSTLATNLTLQGLGGPQGFTPSSLQPAPLFHTTSKNVGTYARLVRDAANPTSLTANGVNYAVGYFNSGTYAITPRALTPVVANKVYDGTSAAAVTATGMVAGDNVRLSGSGSFGAAQAGQYDNVSASGITLSGADAANYTLGGTAVSGMRAAILPREVTLAAQKTYDGTDSLAGAVVIGNLVAGEDLSYSGAAANSLHVDGATHVGAIVLGNGTLGSASNYVLPALNAASSANTAAITPRTLGVQLTDANVAKTYDGSTAAPAGYQPGYSLTGLAAADLGASVALTHTGAAYNSANVAEAQRLTVSGLAVGAVTGGVANAGDYVLDASSKDVAGSIGARQLSVAVDAQSKSYGDADPSLTWRVVNGNLLGADTLSGILSRVAGENVGSYAIDASALANPNYAVTATGASLNVTPRAISVAANGGSKVYGDADPALTWRVVNGSLVGSDTLSGILSRIAGENVGSYAIDASALANPNYAVTATGASLTVTPRAIGVAANGGSKVYGDADPALTWRVVNGNLVGSDTLNGSLARTAGENVGSYAIDASALANPNYAVTATGANMTVTPRAITVAANDRSKVYGDADPALTWRVVNGNLVGSDTLSGSLARAAGENVGSYAIDASRLANGNYALTVQNGVLNVAPRPLSVLFQAQDKVYGDADPLPAYRITAGSLVAGDALDVVRAAGENVGSYAIDASAGANYLLSSTPAALTILPRALAITVDNASKVYGEADPVLGYRIAAGQLVNGDLLGGALRRQSGENAGSYTIDGSALANGNYVLTVQGGTLSIAARPIAVSADSQRKQTGDTDPRLTWRITGGNLVGNDSLAGQLARASGESAGSYAIGQGTLGNANYAIAFNSASLDIAAAPQPVPVLQPMPQPQPLPPVVETPAPLPPAPVVPAPARPAVNASQYTTIVPPLVPPTVGALSYVMVSDNSAKAADGGTESADGGTLERAASHAPTSGRDVKFLDVMVVSGGINTGAAAPAPGN